jgi:endonuclease-3
MKKKNKKKNNKKRAGLILEVLKNTFPDAHIELLYDKSDPWQLLVVVLLSAQTTDKKVNQISKALFERFKTVDDFAKASPHEIEPYIKSIGLYHNKAKNLVLTAQKIVSDFRGQIPKDRKKLEELPGVGPKTSAVIVSNAFKIPALAVDTHVARVSFRLGLTDSTNPKKIELELTELFLKKSLSLAHHTLIFLGRRICLARKPKCSICPLITLCPQIGVKSFQ